MQKNCYEQQISLHKIDPKKLGKLYTVLRNILWVPVIPIHITRLFKAVLTARTYTCKLSTSFLVL